MNVSGPARAAAHTPPVAHLGVAPELAALALLEAALEVTSAALVAAQPMLLRDADLPSDPARVASKLVEQSLALRGTINLYRIALVADDGHDDPLPF